MDIAGSSEMPTFYDSKVLYRSHIFTLLSEYENEVEDTKWRIGFMASVCWDNNEPVVLKKKR